MTSTSPTIGKRPERGMTLVLGIAVIAAVAFAIAASRREGASPAHSAELPVSEPALAAAAEPAPSADSAALAGIVLETIPVSQYTYLRLRTPTGEVWTAVPSANVPVGTQVAVENATRMGDFESKTLKRKFPVIYFGSLANPPAQAAAKFSAIDVLGVNEDSELPPGHPNVAGAARADTDGIPDALPAGHPAVAASPAPLSASKLEIGRASGPGAHDITELGSQKQKLAGQLVRVRGEVTKVTAGVNGRAFFHLRDGAPNQEKPTDLVLTSIEPPLLGQVATFQGKLRTDVDVGIGYTYALLVENAVILADPAL